MKTKQKITNYEYFLKTDTSAYKGEWIAIANKKILVHGKDAAEVYQKAKKKLPKAKISLAKIPEQQVMVLKISL